MASANLLCHDRSLIEVCRGPTVVSDLKQVKNDRNGTVAEVQLAVMRQSLRLRISSSNCVKKVSKPSLIRSLVP